MKLGNLAATLAALTLSAAIPAQKGEQQDQKDMIMSFRVDETGVDLSVNNAYALGNVAILVSTTSGKGGSDVLGYELDLTGPVWPLAIVQANGLGSYHMRIGADTRALANAGLKVYLQAISVGSESGAGNALLISNRLDLDFSEEVETETQGSSEGNDHGEDGKGRRDDAPLPDPDVRHEDG